MVAKFTPPTLANGKVYLATRSGYLDVYGLLNGLPVLSSAAVFLPVVMRLGDHCDDVLDLLVHAERWSSGQKQHRALAPNADVLLGNGPEQPARHRLIVTLQAHPARACTARRGQSRDQLEPTLNFRDHALIGVVRRAHLLWRGWLQEGVAMPGPAGQRQVAEGGPHLIPGDLPGIRVAQWR